MKKTSRVKKASRQQVKFISWVVWSIASLYFLYDFMQQVAPSVISQPLADSLKVNAATVGIIVGIYFYTYGLLQIPVGILVDRFGPRRPLAIAALVAGIGNFLFAHVHSVVAAEILRVFIGAGAGFSFVTVLKIVSNWFPQKYFATLTGVTNVVGMIGAIFAEGPLGLLTNDFGWRGVSVFFGALGIILAVLIFYFVHDFPPGKKTWTMRAGRKRNLKKIWADVKTMFSSYDAWINAAYACLINITYVGFADLWGAQYLKEYYNIGTAEAGGIISFFYVATIPGGLFFGFISDYIRRRKLPMISAALLAVIVMPLIVYVPSMPKSLMILLIFLLGFAGSGNIIAYALGHDIRPPGSAGLSIGFVNTFLIGGSALFQPVIGYVLDFSKSMRTRFNFGGYSLHDYRIALSVIVVTLILTLIAALALKETNCKDVYK